MEARNVGRVRRRVKHREEECRTRGSRMGLMQHRAPAQDMGNNIGGPELDQRASGTVEVCFEKITRNGGRDDVC
jgi:hypothetical protein